MGLILQSERIGALAHELAEITGDNVEAAVEKALAEKLAGLPRRAARDVIEVHAIFERLSQLPVRDSRPAEDIIGFDADGLAVG